MTHLRIEQNTTGIEEVSSAVIKKLYDLVYHSGPHGDECTTYDVKFKKDKITVREFIQNVIELFDHLYQTIALFLVDRF